MVSLRSFNIYITFAFHKSFFIVERGSIDFFLNVLYTHTQNGSFKNCSLKGFREPKIAGGGGFQRNSSVLRLAYRKH